MTVLFTMQAYIHVPATEWYMQEDLEDDKKTNWTSETRDGLEGLTYVAQYTKDFTEHTPNLNIK
jgi:hypothetical protein